VFVGGLFALVGLFSIAVALVVLGLLSRRLGQVTRAPRYYLGFFVAAVLLIVSLLFRLFNVIQSYIPATDDPVAVIFYIGLPAFALTISLMIAWRYWSWLLAERS
jgi:hypothetical protein